MPYYDYEYYKPSRPIEAKGGIKAKSKSGAFGSTWWAKRWVAIDKGLVNAAVQGSRPKPYKVTIKVTALTAPEWERVQAALAEQALFTAKLLAGEMPQDIEQVFKGVGLSLFPERLRDLETDCSCPDYSNPCKHIAAVYYLLGEEFDRDPFLLFQMRGITREELLSHLTAAGPTEAETEGAEAVAAEPLSADTTLFWSGAPLPDDPFGEVKAPPVAAALLKRLGGFPFWRGATSLLDALGPLYEPASAQGMETFLGQSPAGRPMAD